MRRSEVACGFEMSLLSSNSLVSRPCRYAEENTYYKQLTHLELVQSALYAHENSHSRWDQQ